VGLKKRWFSAFLLFSSAAVVNAAPMLRLVNSTVGPIPVAAGGTAPAQTVEAYNNGDGSLNLSVAVPSTVTWLSAALGPQRACQSIGTVANCLPVNFTLNTSSLAGGKTYTAIVTVTDASAATIDAPQTITVTVQVGSVSVYVAPGSSQDIPITTNHQVNYRPTTTDGNNWLTLVLNGTGSFRFVFPYSIHVQPTANMGAGTYNGSLTTSGSSVAGENLTIPVTMQVTTQPIAQASPGQINLRLAQGAPPLVYPFDPFISVVNIGQGTLTAGAFTTTGGSWLKPDSLVPTFLAIDPTGLSTGDNTGTVTIPSNAVNAPSAIPVDVQIVAKGAPYIYYQGVLDNGTFVPGDTVAQGDVMVVKGEQLSFSPFTQGAAPPLANQVGGATILVNGKPAPLFYSSYGQLAFQMPVDTALGTALVQVQRDNLTSNTVSVTVAQRAPRIIAVVNQDGSVNLPDGSHPAHAGDELVIYAIGLGPTSPAVATGAPAPGAEPLARVTGAVVVNFGGGVTEPQVVPDYAGLTPTFAGLYQLNVMVPAEAAMGIVDLSVGFPDSRSNSLKIAIQ